jgi:hypothetical protein
MNMNRCSTPYKAKQYFLEAQVIGYSDELVITRTKTTANEKEYISIHCTCILFLFFGLFIST